MLKFLIKTGLFFIPVIIFVIYLEYQLTKIPNLYNTKKTYLERQLSSTEVLALGGSMTYYAVDPAYLDYKCFNLGCTAQSLFYDKNITLKYVDRMPKLKCVLISVTYASLGNNLYDGPNNWRAQFYYQFWHIRFPELKWYDLRLYSKIMLYTPARAIEYWKGGFKEELENPGEMDENGWFRADTAGNYQYLSDSLGLARVRFHDKLFRQARLDEDVKDLDELISELKKRNIEPVIINSPVSETYWKFMDSSHLQMNEKIISLLCKKYNCLYFNYLEDKRFTSRDFADDDHLNFFGAEKFSKILNEQVLRPVFANK